jgi:gluconate 2-dehydrogenase gamma chain
MKRREFILIPAKALGAAAVASLAGSLEADAQQVKVPLRFFTAEEARVVQTAAERIIPADESGPGATDAGVVVYIDRQLAGPYGRDKYRYTKGPWIEAPLPEHGYQAKATPREVWRAGLQKLGEDFPGAGAAEQDRRLIAIQATPFFRMLRQLTVEGMFSDPLHGGNENMVGWQLIGYPGPMMGWKDHVIRLQGEAFEGKPTSLAQIVGRPVLGWEEEKE